MQEGAVGSPDRPHRGPHERTTPLSAFVGWDWWKLNLSPDKAHEQGTNTAPWGCRCWGVTCPGTQPRGRPQPRALPAAGNTGKVAEAVSHALWCICLTLQEQEGFLPLKYTDPRDTAPWEAGPQPRGAPWAPLQYSHGRKESTGLSSPGPSHHHGVCCRVFPSSAPVVRKGFVPWGKLESAARSLPMEKGV